MSVLTSDTKIVFHSVHTCKLACGCTWEICRRMGHSTAGHLFFPCNDAPASLKDFIHVNYFCRSHCRVGSLSTFHHSGKWGSRVVMLVTKPNIAIIRQQIKQMKQVFCHCGVQCIPAGLVFCFAAYQ